MPRTTALTIGLTLGLALTSARAGAQEPQVDPAAERQAEFSRLFAEGLEAITRRDLPRSEELFKRCVQLFPDQAVSYYNLACTYSLGERADEAVQMLREAFSRGFLDLSHMSRDMDLDPIRRTPVFRAAMSELEATLLRQVGPALTHLPDGAPEGVLVWVHDQGAAPARELERLRQLLPRWALLVPQGVQVRDGFAWDERVEFVVVERLRAFVAEVATRTGVTTPVRALVAGEGGAGVMALLVAVHHPDLVEGVLAAGPNLGRAVDEDLAPSGTRAYLLVQKDDQAQVAAGVDARDRFVKAKSPVVLERYPLPTPLSQDRAVLLRALTWLRGQPIQLPGAGQEQVF